MLLTRWNVTLAVVCASIAWAISAAYFPSIRWTLVAFVCGALSALIGIVATIVLTSRGVRYGEVETKHVTRSANLRWTKDANAWEEEKAAVVSRAEYRRPLIFAEAARFSKALDGLIDLLLQDFVTSWYKFISPRPAFQNEIDRCIRSAILTVVARAAGRDLVVIGLSRLLPIVTIHFNDFYSAEHAIRGINLDHRVTEGEELDAAIAMRFKSGNLHRIASLSATDTLLAQQDYVRNVVARLLPLVLPSNMTTSKAVTILIREIVTCAVLSPVLRLLEDPDTWNQLIVNIAGPMLQDRKTVRKMRAALDKHAPSSPKATRTSHVLRLRPHDSEKQFERFIRSIRQVDNLPDARRCRSEVLSQIRRDSVDPEQDAVYLRRLEAGRQLLNQKIATLMSKDSDRLKLPDRSSAAAIQKKRHAALREVLADAAGLSYFMEYMDRLKLVRLIQFWLVADGIRGPLESDTDELTPGLGDAQHMDIGQMYEAYLSQSELQATDDAMQAARQYLKAGSAATSGQYTRARQAVLRTQMQVFERMGREHFEAFKRSDLYFKWLAIDDNLAATSLTHDLSPTSPTSPSVQKRSASATRRPQLAVMSKESELRRVVLSSAELKDHNPVRRSLDDSRTRSSLFDDDNQSTKSVSSVQSTDGDLESDREAQADARVVHAVQEALDDIVDQAAEDHGSLFADLPGSRPAENGKRPGLYNQSTSFNRPNISSLGLVGDAEQARLGGDLFGARAEDMTEHDSEDSNLQDHSDEDGIQEAAPGDLGLTEAIRALDSDIDRLSTQKSIVESLKGKAELTNNAAELRILRKSEQSLQREMKRKEMQKQQYIVQESDNSLYGKAQITIKSVMVGREDDGREYALYVVEVRREAGDVPAATWAVTRRYSQFHELHKRLRARYPAIRGVEFPRRQALFTLQKNFLEQRRLTLERYLQSLLLVPAICRSRELRSFLSQSAIAAAEPGSPSADARDFVTRIYNSVSDGVEEFMGNIPVLDSLSIAGQNMLSAASQSNGIDSLDPATHDPATAAEAEAELNAYETKDAEPFVKPICDLFLELFELDKGNSWLRGRTIVVVLHQLLGGTIERKVRETADSALEDDSLVNYINILRQTMWPDGRRLQPVARTAAQKVRTKKEAALLLDALLPDLAGSVVGRSKARAAARKIIALFNNERLNTHLVLSLFEEILKIFFTEITTSPL